jgi:hypothetical protein
MWGFFCIDTYITNSNFTISQNEIIDFFVTDFKEQVSVVISVSCVLISMS